MSRGDVLVVGSSLYGPTVAERLTEHGQHIDILECRSRIGASLESRR